jgi:histone H3/H4
MLLTKAKVKEFIKEKSELKTSGKFLEELNRLVELQIDQAIENAQKAKNKTVLDSHLA